MVHGLSFDPHRGGPPLAGRALARRRAAKIAVERGVRARVFVDDGLRLRRPSLRVRDLLLRAAKHLVEEPLRALAPVPDGVPESHGRERPHRRPEVTGPVRRHRVGDIHRVFIGRPGSSRSLGRGVVGRGAREVEANKVPEIRDINRGTRGVVRGSLAVGPPGLGHRGLEHGGAHVEGERGLRRRDRAARGPTTVPGAHHEMRGPNFCRATG